MPRRPLRIPLPDDDPKRMIALVSRRFSRIDLEVSDHRLQTYTVLTLANAATFQQGNLLLLPSRNRRYLQMQASARLAGWAAGTDTLTIKFFAGGLTATDRIFQLVLTIAANGWTSGSTTTIVNPGKENLDATIGWHLEGVHAASAGGTTWNDIHVECVYEDFVPFV